MLPQLVGKPCAVCTGRIPGENDGRFCEVCGNPVHGRCAPPPRVATNEELLEIDGQPRCPRCGCDPATDPARAVRGVWFAVRVQHEQAAGLPHLAVAAEAGRTRRSNRIAFRIYSALFVVVLVLLAPQIARGELGSGWACLAMPLLCAFFTWVVAAVYRREEVRALERWDQATDAAERERIERGPPE